MEPLLTAIAHELLPLLPQGWTETVLEIEVDQGFSKLALTASTPQAEQGIRLGGMIASNVDDHITALHQQMKKDGTGDWKRAKFRLSANGTFKLDVIR